MAFKSREHGNQTDKGRSERGCSYYRESTMGKSEKIIEYPFDEMLEPLGII